MTNSAPATPPKKPDEKASGGLDASTLFSALALLVSFAALTVSLYETSILDTQNRAAVWPYLQLSTSYSEEGWGVILSNRGVGPARVTEQRVVFNDKAVTNPLAVLNDVTDGNPGFGYDLLFASDATDSVMSEEAEKRLFFLPWDPKTRPVINLLANAKIEAQVCYCSIFGECWRVELNKPARADATCRQPED